MRTAPPATRNQEKKKVTLGRREATPSRIAALRFNLVSPDVQLPLAGVRVALQQRGAQAEDLLHDGVLPQVVLALFTPREVSSVKKPMFRSSCGRKNIKTGSELKKETLTEKPKLLNAFSLNMVEEQKRRQKAPLYFYHDSGSRGPDQGPYCHHHF